MALRQARGDAFLFFFVLRWPRGGIYPFFFGGRSPDAQDVRRKDCSERWAASPYSKLKSPTVSDETERGVRVDLAYVNVGNADGRSVSFM